MNVSTEKTVYQSHQKIDWDFQKEVDPNQQEVWDHFEVKRKEDLDLTQIKIDIKSMTD